VFACSLYADNESSLLLLLHLNPIFRLSISEQAQTQREREREERETGTTRNRKKNWGMGSVYNKHEEGSRWDMCGDH
jgi:hypothetical protein